MSIERHPNLNAAGLVADLYRIIDTRIRGVATDHKRLILSSPRVAKKISDFVNELDEDIDELMKILEKN